MRPLRFATASICFALLAACGGGGDSTTAPTTGNQNPGGGSTPTGSARMTATVDGRAWTGTTSFAIQSDPVASRYLLTGIETGTNISMKMKEQLGKGAPKLFTPWMALQDQELVEEG